MNCPRHQSRVLQSPCVSAGLKDQAAFVREMRDASALQHRLTAMLARIADRLDRISAAIPARIRLERRFFS